MPQSLENLIQTKRFIIPQSLIPKLRELQTETRKTYHDKIAESEDAVFMTLGLGDAMYLALDGRVIIDEWNYPDADKVREAKDEKEMFMTVIVGAAKRNAPELLMLLPSRPDGASDCLNCEKGWINPGVKLSNGELWTFICGECGGVGWIK